MGTSRQQDMMSYSGWKTKSPYDEIAVSA